MDLKEKFFVIKQEAKKKACTQEEDFNPKYPIKINCKYRVTHCQHCQGNLIKSFWCITCITTCWMHQTCCLNKKLKLKISFWCILNTSNSSIWVKISLNSSDFVHHLYESRRQGCSLHGVSSSPSNKRDVIDSFIQSQLRYFPSCFKYGLSQWSTFQSSYLRHG